MWVEHFSNLNRKDPANDPQSQEYCREIEVEVNSILSQTPVTKCHITDRPFTLDEVKWGLRQLKRVKQVVQMGLVMIFLYVVKKQ